VTAEAPDAGTAGTSPWWTVVGVAVSVGLVATILLQLGAGTSDALAMIARLPPGVWPALLLLYLAQPVCDFAVYRRTWDLPFAGVATMLRKNVINEVVLGYSGQAYLYVWARRAAGSVAQPFRAIKDATIISALLGNVLTLGLAAVSATRLQGLDLAQRLGPALWSGLIPVAISVGLLAFGPHVFSLRLGQLAYVGAAHTLRLVASVALTVLIWRMALPQVAPGDWLVLLAVRYLVSRIPFLPNKDLVFGNLMLLLLGADASVAVLQAALGLVTLFLHLMVVVLLGGADLARGVWRNSLARGPISPATAEIGGPRD
jgi:hypothetical protein